MTVTALPTAPAHDASRDEPLLREVFGALLRRTRSERGMTLRELAAASTVSLAYLSEIERGHKEPSSEVLGAVCHALGLRMLDLVHQATLVLAAHERATASPAGVVALAA
ncbi:MAG: helix-turn-helix transcriptional regulator [Nocardioidaceae bacterium]|nr:helix-turn-helix transcriptional regulator [Nocardioidaceae bacterium]